MKTRHGELDAVPHQLPTREVREFISEKNKLIPTPLDGRGLVDGERLIARVKSKVNPSYPLNKGKRNIHHYYHPHKKYSSDHDGNDITDEFCELPINKIIVPVEIHGVIHKFFEPPVMPSEEVMLYIIEAQRVAVELFRRAILSEQLITSRYITDERLQRGLSLHFEEFCAIIDNARARVPREYELFDPAAIQPENATDLPSIVPILGRVALIGTRVSDIERPLAA